MQNELNLDNELRIGDIVGATKRIVIASTKQADRIPDDSYAHWITICHKEGELHPYVVWSVVATRNGFEASNGDYCTTLKEAVTMYKKRGGEA
jgi:hypothetical protein